MNETLSRSWALLLGVMLLQVGNGIQGTLLGVRGALESFSTYEMSAVMSAYFLGFLGGSRFAPELIRRVGHVRVFAALASFISAMLILFPAIAHPAAWIVFRVVMGFCFSGVYVTAESWLNNAASNENRGMALSLYMIVQMVGIVSAQALLAFGDPSGFVLFIIPSVLVSIAFAPILLSVTPMPAYASAKPMGVLELLRRAPLSSVSIFLLGGVFSAIFGMTAVYGGQAGLTVVEISIFVGVIYLGGLFLQFPIGYLSDRMDRRRLILIVALVMCAASLLGMVAGRFELLLVVGFLIGGTANPLYGLTIAYMNDYLEPEEMASASGRLLFLNGVGAVGGPLVLGWMMQVVGPEGFYLFIALLMAVLVVYGVYRSFQREAPSVDELGSYVPVSPTASTVSISSLQDVYAEHGDHPHMRHAADYLGAPQDGEEEPEELLEELPERRSE